MIYSNGDLYDGEYNNGYIHGKGTMIYSNGDVYNGKWEYNDMVEGTINYANGEIKQIKLNIEVILPYSNGAEFYNKWWKDEFERKNVALK